MDTGDYYAHLPAPLAAAPEVTARTRDSPGRQGPELPSERSERPVAELLIPGCVLLLSPNPPLSL
jgi:hypothetical protein